MTTADLLEAARQQHGHNYSQAARAIGTTYVTYKAWRRGQVPSFKWADPIAVYADRDPNEVLATIVSDQLAAVHAAGVTRSMGVYVAWLAA